MDDAYLCDGPAWKMVASHFSVVTRDPPAQEVPRAGWPGLAGRCRLLPDGWTLTRIVNLRKLAALVWTRVDPAR